MDFVRLRRFVLITASFGVGACATEDGDAVGVQAGARLDGVALGSEREDAGQETEARSASFDAGASRAASSSWYTRADTGLACSLEAGSLRSSSWNVPDAGPSPWNVPDAGPSPWSPPEADAAPPLPHPPNVTPIDPESPVKLDDGSCTGLSQARAQPFEADTQPAATLSALEALEATRRVMAGSWVGVAQAPDGWLPQDWLLELELRVDRTYEASSYTTNPAGSVAFYYGSDECALKHWDVESIGTTGVNGSIEVPFSYGSSGCGLPAWDGVLERIVLNASGNRLRFHFRTSSGYGPVTYDLFRSCLLPAP